MSAIKPPHEDILKSLEKHDQAGGHAGVMRSGSLIIKPCTQEEIDFYAIANQTQPLFASWMPTYMGQLTLSKPGESSNGTLNVLESERFDQAIVLENLEWGFQKPSVLDIKLGKVLTDELVSEEKRLRLEKVSMSTTSWENHIRLTGMRVCPLFGNTDVGLGSASRRTYCISEGVWTDFID
jgi:inositol-polyphosphate multikinase